MLANTWWPHDSSSWRPLASRRYRRTMLCLCTFVALHVNSTELHPFTSDGCSAFPDGTWDQNTLWLTCCTAHDFAYWKGGTYKQREEADRELQACVSQAGKPHISMIMLVGVRVGGTPFLPTTFRWGYGWKYPRVYRELTAEEREQVTEQNLTNPALPSILLPEK